MAAGSAWASTVSMDSMSHTDPGELVHPADSDGVVFETVDFFKAKTFFASGFDIDTAGTYQVTLTDFEFLQPMFKSSLHITTSTESLLMLDGPGEGTFVADPGSYYVSFFALAGHDWGRQHGEYHRNHPGGHSEDEHPQGGKHGEDDYGFDDLYGDHVHGHGPMNFSQYGIEVALIDPQAAVPVPAAVWLFGSGLVGMAGVALRKRA
jgi:hypothetical protein